MNNNKVQLYNTENYTLYMTSHNGKEQGKKEYIYTHTHKYIYIYIYIKLNHFAVQQKLTQHCKSTIFSFLKIVCWASLVAQW